MNFPYTGLHKNEPGKGWKVELDSLLEAELTVKIFNRWGALVYNSDNYITDYK